MSHYAKVLAGVVVQVIAAEADFFNTFVDSSPGTWIKTSYNTRGGIHYAPDSTTPDNGIPLRGNYAGVGYIYDAAHDVFYPPKPFPSWTISAPTWTWVAPVSMPTTGGPYMWNELTQTWTAIPT